MRTRRMVMVLAIVAMVMGVMAPASAGGPRCGGGVPSLGITADWANHAEHVIGNYLLGNDIGVDVEWPIEPGSIRAALAGVGPGKNMAEEGPGSFGHRQAPLAPGASLCDPINP